MGRVKSKMIVGDAVVEMAKMRTGSVDLVFGSPPYCEVRKHGKQKRRCDEWVAWMLGITDEALRVSRGPVLWVIAGTENYHPAPEGLMWEGRKRGWLVLRPCIWTKNAPPTGSGWFSNDWEYVVAFCKSKPLPYWNPEAIGTPLKYRNGGAFRQRGKDGKRRRGSDYPTHRFRKRPSNVFHVLVGGGHMGHELACENEAPFPEKIVEPFVKTLCPPGGTVLDPFAGSGTTLAVALAHGRNAIGIDILKSQKRLTERRLKGMTNGETDQSKKAGRVGVRAGRRQAQPAHRADK